MSPSPYGSEERRAECDDEEGEPDWAKFGEYFEVEVVDVLDRAGDRAVGVPVALVGAGAIAEHGVILVLVPGDAPLSDATVAGEVEEAGVQVRASHAGWALEGVIGVPSEGRR